VRRRISSKKKKRSNDLASPQKKKTKEERGGLYLSERGEEPLVYNKRRNKVGPFSDVDCLRGLNTRGYGK